MPKMPKMPYPCATPAPRHRPCLPPCPTHSCAFAGRRRYAAWANISTAEQAHVSTPMNFVWLGVELWGVILSTPRRVYLAPQHRRIVALHQHRHGKGKQNRISTRFSRDFRRFRETSGETRLNGFRFEPQIEYSGVYAPT